WRTVKVTSSTVIRSIRALSCLDEKGRWTDPPSTHILVRGNDASAADARSSDSGLPEPGVTSTTDIREASPPAVSACEVGGSLATSHSPALGLPAVAGEVEGSPSTERSEPSPPRVGKIEEDAAFPHSFEQREPRHGGSAAFCAKETEENGAMPPSSPAPRVEKIEEDGALPHSFEQREPRHG